MKTLFKFSTTVIILAIGVILAIVYIVYTENNPNEKKTKIVISEMSAQPGAPYRDEPFRIKTTKDEFDSLGIKISFYTQLPYFKEKNIKESLWNPKNFAVYKDGYFVWEGNNLENIFVRNMERYPGCEFILIGGFCGKFFVTERMFIVW